MTVVQAAALALALWLSLGCSVTSALIAEGKMFLLNKTDYSLIPNLGYSSLPRSLHTDTTDSSMVSY